MEAHTLERCPNCGFESEDDTDFNGELCWNCFDSETYLTPLEQTCYDLLSKKHYVLWANWDVSKEDSRREAARWLARQVKSVFEVMY